MGGARALPNSYWSLAPFLTTLVLLQSHSYSTASIPLVATASPGQGTGCLLCPSLLQHHPRGLQVTLWGVTLVASDTLLNLCSPPSSSILKPTPCWSFYTAYVRLKAAIFTVGWFVVVVVVDLGNMVIIVLIWMGFIKFYFIKNCYKVIDNMNGFDASNYCTSPQQCPRLSRLSLIFFCSGFVWTLSWILVAVRYSNYSSRPESSHHDCCATELQ